VTDRDEWGRDPSVQFIRRVFTAMEGAQLEFLKQLDISLYDLRIRRWREQALTLFERTWGVAHRMGIAMDEQIAVAVYLHCLAKIIGSEGTPIPADMVPQGKDAERLLKEAFS
jgi:hypothetical protein